MCSGDCYPCSSSCNCYQSMVYSDEDCIWVKRNKYGIEEMPCMGIGLESYPKYGVN